MVSWFSQHESIITRSKGPEQEKRKRLRHDDVKSNERKKGEKMKERKESETSRFQNQQSN